MPLADVECGGGQQLRERFADARGADVDGIGGGLPGPGIAPHAHEDLELAAYLPWLPQLYRPAEADADQDREGCQCVVEVLVGVAREARRGFTGALGDCRGEDACAGVCDACG